MKIPNGGRKALEALGPNPTVPRPSTGTGGDPREGGPKGYIL